MNGNNKRFVIDTNFIKASLKNNLSLEEFLLVLFFDNSYDSTFDIELIKPVLNLNEEKILEIYSSLLSKNVIKVKTEKNNDGKICEKIYLEEFYRNIMEEQQKEDKKKMKEDIFSVFEQKFGRTLSGMDYEVINAWITNGFSEELIIAALNEAVYNGVTNLRYIDKILYEWNKKNIKTVADLHSSLGNEDEIPLYETKILNFNWLDENK